MARGAILRNTSLRVVRICGRVEVFLVTGNAACGRAFEFVVDMTRRAVEGRVHASQSKSCQACVIELRTEPGVQAVARFTCHREVVDTVVEDGRLVVACVARIAIGRKPLELAHRRSLVAGSALHQRMSANQGESVVMVLDRLKRYLPALDCMALLAIRSELATMQVRVAVGALSAYVLEDETCMALPTAHVDMHSTQRITRLIVIELRHAADRLPVGECVAVLTRARHCAVGIGYLRTRRRDLLLRPGSRRQE